MRTLRPEKNLMADDTSVRSGIDPSRINTGQPHEVDYWTTALGCTPEQLKTAVLEVGSSADAVRRHLGLDSEKRELAERSRTHCEVSENVYQAHAVPSIPARITCCHSCAAPSI